MDTSTSLAQELLEAVKQAEDFPEIAAWLGLLCDYLLAPDPVELLGLSDKCKLLIAACEDRNRVAIIRARWHGVIAFITDERARWTAPERDH